MPSFSPEQDAALKAVADWLKAKPGQGGTPLIFRLFGYAGTGKTTLARHIAEHVDGKVLFAAFTGKAALVMRSKGCERASTIHSLIYKPRESGEEVPSFDLWDDAPASKAALIVIDECSMVDSELGRDVKSFGVPLLVLGDPAQLPPIQGGGFFTDADPDAMLTEVHRQAEGNPIIRLSMDIRAGRELEPGSYGETQIVSREDLDGQRVLDADQVLVGRNATRRAYNARLRQRRGFEGELPASGDKLVCLRNNKRKGLFNGALWSVKEKPSTRRDIIKMRLQPDDGFAGKGIKVSVRPECFTGGIEGVEWPLRKRFDEFDYGYVLTVHKAQGSQWDDVVLFDESAAFTESRQRWLYTGVTRSVGRWSPWRRAAAGSWRSSTRSSSRSDRRGSRAHRRTTGAAAPERGAAPRLRRASSAATTVSIRTGAACARWRAWPAGRWLRSRRGVSRERRHRRRRRGQRGRCALRRPAGGRAPARRYRRRGW
jgi:exodeoxyribonuclease-5